MLNFGWPELLLIMAIAIFVIGPKDIPKTMFWFGRMVRRLQYMKYALTQQFDEFMQENDLAAMQNLAEIQKPGRGVKDPDESQSDEAFAQAVSSESEEDQMLPLDQSSKDEDDAGKTKS